MPALERGAATRVLLSSVSSLECAQANRVPQLVHATKYVYN
jgi:hypothetical protein